MQRYQSAVLVACALAYGCTGSSSEGDGQGGTAGIGEATGGGSGDGGKIGLGKGGNTTNTGGTTGSAGSGGSGGGSSNAGGAGGRPDSQTIVGKGMLDCPAVTAPAYTLVPQGGSLSPRFQSTCAGCHGPGGVGRPGYPALPGALTAEQYKTTVRQGRGTNMPAFDATVITDAEIAADYAALKQGTGMGVGMATNGRTAPSTWSASKQAAVLKRGLEMLRKPDKYGTACANCHSPDAIELAAIAFTDDDVLRRGLQHVAAEDALDLVDYVHALRAKYNITQPCSKSWRPFQPGGEPLPGKTVQEREIAFAKELEKRNLLIAQKPITSLAEAKMAADQIEAVSLRTLPVGVHFPRWSEDAFNGEEHRSFNDWMPGGGRVPTNPTTWYALHDKYLAEPTIANLSTIHQAIKGSTKLSRADSHGREISANFSTTYDAQGWMEDVLRIKHESVLAGAHFFRLALMKQPGWLERPALPFPELAADYGPFFHQGLLNAESPCYSNPDCDKEVAMRLPAFMKEEFGNLGPTAMSMDVLSDPWSYLGQLMDHTLLSAENTRGPTIDGHYWNLFTFEHRFIQQPFFSAHRIVSQEAYATKYKGTDKMPTNRGLPAHPLLHGDWTDVQGLEPNGRIEQDDPRMGPSTFLRANVALMLAYLQKSLLQSGQPVVAKAKLLTNLNQSRMPAQDLMKALENKTWAAANPKNKDNAAILGAGLLKLLDEVESLIKAAPGN